MLSGNSGEVALSREPEEKERILFCCSFLFGFVVVVYFFFGPVGSEIRSSLIFFGVLTSRQVSTILSCRGHAIHFSSSLGLTLTKLTIHITKSHLLPPFNTSPYLWFAALIDTLRHEPFDLLLAAQEPIAILSAEYLEIEKTGVKLTVPSFASLRKVVT